MKKTVFHLYSANCAENATNTVYPNAKEITSAADLNAAARFDHVAGRMRNGKRGNDNFIGADCVLADLDNTHSEEPDEWQDYNSVAEALPDVEFYVTQSRNHMKPKSKRNNKTGEVINYEARPKYHFYFPLGREVDRDEYYSIVEKLKRAYPLFDAAVAEPNRFLFATRDPNAVHVPGDIPIDECLKSIPDSQMQIGAGQPAEPADADGLPFDIGIVERDHQIVWLEKWARDNGVILGKRYPINDQKHPNAIAISVECPWENEHSMTGAENEAVIIIDSGGKLNFVCRHSHGENLNWKKYRAEVERRAQARRAKIADLSGVSIAGEEITPPMDMFFIRGQEAAEKQNRPPAGLLTYNRALEAFEKADDKVIEMRDFPQFCRLAKIKLHDSVVIAADTGAGKSSLAINFIDNLNDEYPVMYFNLEMDELTILRRLVSIRTGIELDRIEGYKHDENTAAAVKTALKTITDRKPLQIIQDKYGLREIENEIKSATANREEPTIVVIDHSLLVTIDANCSRYERFTLISEALRRIARLNNVIMFVLTQQNRTGKGDPDARPANSSLKESGSWENDATHIIFLWYDPNDRTKKILLTKNRAGALGDVSLEYYSKTQFYKESKNQPKPASAKQQKKAGRRKAESDQLQEWFEKAYIATGGKVTLYDMAEAGGVTTRVVRSRLKEYGGYTVDGEQYDAAGIDTDIEQNEFIRMTPGEAPEFDEEQIQII